MTFHNQTVEVQVHSLLAKRGYQFTLSSDMARVAEDRQIRNAATQFDRNVPLGEVAVYLFIVAAETAVDSTQTFQTCIADTDSRDS